MCEVNLNFQDVDLKSKSYYNFKLGTCKNKDEIIFNMVPSMLQKIQISDCYKM